MLEDIKRRIEHNFTYHAPAPDQIDRYEKLRAAAKDLATLVADLCPSSREMSLALTAIEEAIMWANAAIARNETPAESPAPETPKE